MTRDAEKTKVEHRWNYVGTALEHHNDCSDHQETSSNTIMETRLKLHEVELGCLRSGTWSHFLTLIAGVI